MTNRNIISKKLLLHREIAQETQQDVAAAVEVTAAAISLYESGKAIPSDDVKIKLAKHFGTTVGQLFYGERS